MAIKTIYDAPKQDTGVSKDIFRKRATALRSEGMMLSSTYRELQKFLNPTRGKFDDGKPNSGKKIDHKTMLNSHAEICIRDTASGMMSGFASPARPWYKVETPDMDLNEFAPVKLQLDEVARRMMAVMATSNNYDMDFAIYEEILTFGTACGMMLEDYWDVMRGVTFTCGEYYLGFDDTGRLNALYRKVWKTIGQLVKEFGLKNCSADIQARYKNDKIDEWIQIHHLIEDNDKRIPFFQDFRNMPYRSIYWEDGNKDDSYLRIGGYEECPMFGPRWQVNTTADYYGTGPGWKVLGHVKQLQKEVKDKLLSIEKVGNPPMQADASVDGEINTLPGGVTKFSAQLPNAGLKPAYQVSPDINALREDIMEVKAEISDMFYSNLFRKFIDIDRSGVTATEIAESKAQQLSLLAPFSDRLNNEYFNKKIERLFGIMLRNNQFPEFPEEMKGMDLKVKYISLMAQAQKMVGITAIENAILFDGKLAQMNPDVMHNINFDEAHRVYFDMIGVPAKLSNSPEQVAEIRKMIAEQKAQLAKIQNAQVMADMAAKTGKTVKDMATAPMNQGSALDGLIKTAKDMKQ